MLWIEQVKHARRAGCPLMAINTPDPAATMRAVAKEIGSNGSESPIVSWDVCRGTVPVNEAGRAVADMTGQGDEDQTMGQPGMFVAMATKFPANTIVFVQNADQYFDATPVYGQGVWNLRDLYKGDHRMLVLLAPNLQPPAFLKDDIVVIDEPLPTDEELHEVVRECDQSRVQAGKGALSDEKVGLAVEAIRGLNAFAAEQGTAMALRSEGIDLDHLWESKRKQIELTEGLSVWRGDESFDDVCGLEFIKGFMKKISGGKKPPNAIIWIDEIEKMIAGASGGSSDSSGVSQGILGAMLTAMQNQNARGVLCVGSAGSGKSLVSKAVGKEAGVPTVAWDSNAMKNSLVGASEAAVRTALKVISAVSSDNALWIATCNSVKDIPVALRRRFSYGTYYFDLPSAHERKVIWDYYIKKFGITKKQLTEIPNDNDWTGAEIKTCCELAWDLDCTTAEAGKYLVPVAVAAPADLEALRVEAEGRYLSASFGNTYNRKRTTVARDITL